MWQRSNLKLITSSRDRFSKCLLSLGNRAGIAHSRKDFTKLLANVRALVKIWNLFPSTITHIHGSKRKGSILTIPRFEKHQ